MNKLFFFFFFFFFKMAIKIAESALKRRVGRVSGNTGIPFFFFFFFFFLGLIFWKLFWRHKTENIASFICHYFFNYMTKCRTVFPHVYGGTFHVDIHQHAGPSSLMPLPRTLNLKTTVTPSNQNWLMVQMSRAYLASTSFSTSLCHVNLSDDVRNIELC